MTDNIYDQDPPKKWYKRWWVIFIMVVLAILLAFLLAFSMRVYSLVKQMEKEDTLLTEPDKFTLINIDFVPPPEQAIVETADDPSFGVQEAKVVIVEFSDFECPYSRMAYPVVRELLTKYQEKIKFIYRDFPAYGVHFNAEKAAEAANCASEQGQFWTMHDKLFQNQENLTIPYLKFYAREIGLNEREFSLCLDSGKYQEEVKEDFTQGIAAGVRGTPTFFINGQKVEGALPRKIFNEIIEKELQGQ